ncbi:hypothetical protein RC62_438 [Flavobacterium aquidurense]|uniref:Uncharacterized protein n=1 Tax=Flavobacterium aquidurense TaxID=362413 RepID=A0A0Q0W844_9FLAO|nr:hypothetical protein RC62_438 [Flavobacterium aquidurense]
MAAIPPIKSLAGANISIFFFISKTLSFCGIHGKSLQSSYK